MRFRTISAVSHIADDRVSDMRHLHADLMTSAGCKFHADKRKFPDGLEHFISKFRIFCAFGDFRDDANSIAFRILFQVIYKHRLFFFGRIVNDRKISFSNSPSRIASDSLAAAFDVFAKTITPPVTLSSL